MHVTRSIVCSVTLAGALLLGGCSGVGSSDAAVVDGMTISESDLQEVTSQFNQVAAQQASPAEVLNTLIQVPTLEEAVAGSGQEVTDREVLTQLEAIPEAPAEPNELMVDLLRGLVYLQLVGGAAPPELLAEVDVDLNPRYGTWDPEGLGVVQDVPEWITPASSPEGER